MSTENNAGTSTESTESAEDKPSEMGPQAEGTTPRRRGFAAMDSNRVKEIASKGGRAAHAAGTAHQFSADEARNAGRKGGMAPHVRRGGVRRRPGTGDVTPPTTPERDGNGRG